MPEVPNATGSSVTTSDALNAGGASRPSGQASSHAPEPVTLPDYMKGSISSDEFAALAPEAQRKLVAMGESLYKNVSRKETALSADRKRVDGLLSIQDQLDADPKMAAHLEKALEAYKTGKTAGNGQALQDEWEQLKAESDDGGKRVMTAIEKRFGAGHLEQKIDALMSRLGQIEAGSQGSRRQQLEEQLGQLPKAYKGLAEEHREQLLKLGVQPAFQTKTVRDLLRHVAPLEAYEDAVFTDKVQRSKKQVTEESTTALFPADSATAEVVTAREEDFNQPHDRRFGKTVKLGNLIKREFANIAKSMPR